MIQGRLMTDLEWRSLGVRYVNGITFNHVLSRQSPGWTHYMIHSIPSFPLVDNVLDPEPHILLFRRDIEDE